MASYTLNGNGNGFTEKTRFNGLPTHSSAVREKWHRHHATTSWLTPISLPIPGVPTRRLRLMAPNPARLHRFSTSRFGRTRGPFILCMGLVVTLFTVFALHKRFATGEKSWPTLNVVGVGDSTTLVFRKEDLQRIWEWEIAAGHYPSSHKIPTQIGLTTPPANPALPPHKAAIIPSKYRSPTVTYTTGVGPKRVYLDLQSRPPNIAYPPRPVPGSVADLEVIMEHCDFSTKQYVRDCLEVLRVGGGLDPAPRLRRGKLDEWKYLYLEQGEPENITEVNATLMPAFALKTQGNMDVSAGFTKKRGVEWEPPLQLPPPPQYRPYKSLSSACDPEHPRLYHMFWAGPFTDKPYLALLSFLYTQNLGLHLDDGQLDPSVCRPVFWMWINPGPAAAVPNPNAVRDMFDDLKSNPWASPFLHPRFKDIIRFKMWNTTEQLDGIPELKDEWRRMRDSLFNSGGQVEKVPDVDSESSFAPELSSEQSVTDESTAAAAPSATGTKSATEGSKHYRVGSKSPAHYDRLSVILSDMARFVLCHRFGGIYLDADVLLLRDWEELWNWKGAYAYRWSRWEKYNTAVLHLNKGSALGSFLFRTALKNGLDFHPMSVSSYMEHAYLEGLLLRLADALFDPAWLNMEGFQLDRPPQPFFNAFEEFFDTPLESSATPQAVGFNGFFRGAYAYHYHNSWWHPFDTSRNFPDLGERFKKGEEVARAAVSETGTYDESKPDLLADDKRDLDWSTVLKRTFEAFVRGDGPNMYGEWLKW